MKKISVPRRSPDEAPGQPDRYNQLLADQLEELLFHSVGLGGYVQSVGRKPRATAIATMSATAICHQIVETVSDVVIRYDRQRRRTYVSPSARAVLGYEPAEIIGRDLGDLLHPDDAERTMAGFRAIGVATASTVLTARIRRADGVYIVAESSYRYLPGDGGIVAVMRDLSLLPSA